MAVVHEPPPKSTPEKPQSEGEAKPEASPREEKARLRRERIQVALLVLAILTLFGLVILAALFGEPLEDPGYAPLF